MRPRLPSVPHGAHAAEFVVVKARPNRKTIYQPEYLRFV
jgi:hypothetical protein